MSPAPETPSSPRPRWPSPEAPSSLTPAELANRAAGIVVGKLGTATVEPEELIGLPSRPQT